MASLVSFDAKGVVGPALYLIHNSQFLNPAAIEQIVRQMQTNYQNQTGTNPRGLEEYCLFVSRVNYLPNRPNPTEVVTQRLFKNMAGNNPLPPYHDKVIGIVVPRMLKHYVEHIPKANSEDEHSAKVKDWLARCLEIIVKPDFLASQCNEGYPTKVIDERGNLGKAIYALALKDDKDKLKQEDLDNLLKIARLALDNFKNTPAVLELTGRYLTLFSWCQESVPDMPCEMLGLLDTTFRKKIWPQPDQKAP